MALCNSYIINKIVCTTNINNPFLWHIMSYGITPLKVFPNYLFTSMFYLFTLVFVTICKQLSEKNEKWLQKIVWLGHKYLTNRCVYFHRFEFHFHGFLNTFKKISFFIVCKRAGGPSLTHPWHFHVTHTRKKSFYILLRTIIITLYKSYFALFQCASFKLHCKNASIHPYGSYLHCIKEN